MLRSYIGDEAFFASLKRYLTDNAFTAVEADELRMAFEDVTGQDLNWFFDQWYFGAGHPVFKVEKNYDETSKNLTITLKQTQDPEKSVPVFIMPIPVDIYDASGNVSRHEITVNERKQSFEIPVSSAPSLVMLDPDGSLLFEKKEEKTTEAYIMQYDQAQRYLGRREAMRNLKGKAEAQSTFTKALEDNHWSIRAMAVQGISTTDNPALVDKLKNLAKNDAHSSVRLAALNKVADVAGPSFVGDVENIIKNEQVYSVVGAALGALSKLDQTKALAAAKNLETNKNGSILQSVAGLYTKTGDTKHIPFFEKNLDNLGGWPMINFYSSYAKLLTKGDTKTLLTKVMNLKGWATDMENSAPIKRFASTRAISDVIKELGSGEENKETVSTFKGYIDEIKGAETNDQLKQMYNSF
jgi:aminopeptidase N